MSFTEELETPAGFEMSFKDALQDVCESVLTKLAVPQRLLDLTERFHGINKTFNELHVYCSRFAQQKYGY